MPSGQRDIIVGGGLTPVAPSTQYQIPMFADIIPDFLTDTILREVLVSGGNVTHIVVGTTDPPTVGGSPTATFRTQEGLISTSPLGGGSVVLGEAAQITGGVSGQRAAIAIGYMAAANYGNGDDGSICIGYNANDNDQAGSTVIGSRAFGGGGGMVVIGELATGQGGSGITIGAGSLTTNAGSGFAIGHNARQNAVEGMAIGNGAIAGAASSVSHSIAIGNVSTVSGGDTVAIGGSSFAAETSFFAENVVIGHAAGADGGAFESIAIGYAAHAQHSDSILLGARISSDFARQFKVGTGAGGLGAGPIYGVFIGGRDQYAGYEGITYRHVNGSGTDNSVGPLQFISPLGTGNGNAAVGGLTQGIEFYTAAVPTASGSAVQAQALNFKILSQAAVLTNTDAPIALPNYFDGAGAAAGTLLNAPKAGNPQAWVPVNLKGVVHWFPAWHL